MNLGVVDCFLPMAEEYQKDSETAIISRKLRDFMVDQGTLSYLEGHEVYTYLMEFHDDDGDSFTKQDLRDNDMNTDVSTMTDTELFNYLRGEYLLNGGMNRLVKGFSAVQVEQY